MYVNSHFCLDHFAPSFPKVAICGLQGSVTDFRVRNLQKSQNRHSNPARPPRLDPQAGRTGCPRVGTLYSPRPDARLSYSRFNCNKKENLSLSLSLGTNFIRKVAVVLNWISSPQCWCKNAWHSARTIRSPCSRVWPCPRASQICHR